MSIREFLTTASFIMAIMAIATGIEMVAPLFAVAPNPGRRHANLGLTGIAFVSNWLLLSVAATAAAFVRPSGLLAGWRWPGWAEVAIGVVILDFTTGYLSHRTMHMWLPLWRFHRVHHSDPFVDATTTFRTHPVESAWRFLFTIVPVWALGLSPEAVVTHRVLQVLNGVFEHANVRVWPGVDRLVSLVWATPNVHKIHHSRRLSETNSNYANLLTVFDRVLGTYISSSRVGHVTYGLEHSEALSRGSCSQLLSIPFETVPSQPDRNVRNAASAES